MRNLSVNGKQKGVLYKREGEQVKEKKKKGNGHAHAR